MMHIREDDGDVYMLTASMVSFKCCLWYHCTHRRRNDCWSVYAWKSTFPSSPPLAYTAYRSPPPMIALLFQLGRCLSVFLIKHYTGAHDFYCEFTWHYLGWMAVSILCCCLCDSAVVVIRCGGGRSGNMYTSCAALFLWSFHFCLVCGYISSLCGAIYGLTSLHYFPR